jgi:ABC-type transport system substrate-binding protein/PKD repeat protein
LAVSGEIELAIGCPGDGYALETLNPLFANTYYHRIQWLCYSTLIMDDIGGTGYIGDLADSWDVSEDGTLWHLVIHGNVYFYDSREGVQIHQVTAADVTFTYWTVQNITNYLERLLWYTVDGVRTPVIKDMWTDGPYDVYLETAIPFAPLLKAFSEIPILPRYYWNGEDPTEFENELLIGSGPFYYGLAGLPDVGEDIVFHGNPVWFQEDLRGWQLHMGTLRFVPYVDEAAAYAALVAEEPAIDIMMGVPTETYVSQIPSEPASAELVRFASTNGFLYELNLNQLTDDLREGENKWLLDGTNNPLLRDPVVKRAIAMCVDKDWLIYEAINGIGTVADSLIPDSSSWHYGYGAAEGEVPHQADPLQAREDLIAAGWAYNDAGEPCDGTTLPLCREGGTDPLEFRFFTPNVDPIWEIGANLILNWCAMAGVKLNLELKSLYQMRDAWGLGDYDVWFWSWDFSPLPDPSVDTLYLQTTSAIWRGFSDVFYSNETFDLLYNQSLNETNIEARGLVLDSMQRIAYEDSSCQCIAYGKDLFAATEKDWTCYGNWSEQYLLRPEIGLPWLYMQISPTANMAPIVQVAEGFDGDVAVEVTVGAILSDDSSSLEYRWFWGDGTSTDWLPGSSGVAGHAYEEDGYYVACVAARENGGDGFITWNRTTICVSDDSNTAPHPSPGFEDSPITYLPADPGLYDAIAFTPHFFDDEDDELSYMWDFGDGFVCSGSSAEHRYISSGIHTIVVSVTDGRIGSGDRPVLASTSISVPFNSPPTVELSELADVFEDTPTAFSVYASDDDPLRFTWDWGDGNMSVTEVNSTVHTYTESGGFSLTVHADDMTGIPGHNVSDTVVVVVVNETNDEPFVDDLPNLMTLANAAVLFSVVASDPDGDDLSVWWDFGDESPMEPGAEVTHVYAVPGVYEYRVYVDDGHGHNVTSDAIVTVTVEDEESLPPEIDLLEDRTAYVGMPVQFSAVAIDPDGDSLVYTWDFGDNSDLVTGQTVEHVFFVAGEYTVTVYVDDGEFNESESATMTVSASDPPVADAGPDQTVAVGDEVTLDGADSTDDISVENYTWTFVYDGELLALYGVSPEFAFEITGDYEITLLVRDIEGQNDTDTVMITVEEEDGVGSGDEKSFLESYGVVLAVFAAVFAVVALLAILLLKSRKGAE